jgi:hypothetical protein
MKLWRLLKIEGSDLMYVVPPAYIGERRTTFAKTYGIKVKCLNGEHVGEPIRNLERTHWETWKIEKKSFSSPKLIRNKSKAP